MKSIPRSLAAFALIAVTSSSFAGGNLSVSREVVVDRAPATVWKLMGEFNSLDVWLPPVLSSTFTGNRIRPGAVRVLDLGDNATVTERLLSFDSAKYRYTYAFVKSPLPVKNYVATVELSPAAEGKTLIKWHSTFDAAGAPDDKAKEAIQGIYDVGLAKAAAIFKK